jgi:hypothetical protein
MVYALRDSSPDANPMISPSRQVEGEHEEACRSAHFPLRAEAFLRSDNAESGGAKPAVDRLPYPLHAAATAARSSPAPHPFTEDVAMISGCAAGCFLRIAAVAATAASSSPVFSLSVLVNTT